MLSEKAMHILHVLMLNQESFMTVKALSSMLGISERTVNTYLKEVADFCKKQGISYVSRRGMGICLELNQKTKTQILEDIGQKNLHYDEKGRQNYICHVLLDGWENYTAAMFAEELCVSRQTMGTDLAEAKQWFAQHELYIHKKSRLGMVLVGTEAARRSALAALFRRENPQKLEEDNLPDYRLFGCRLSYLYHQEQRALVKTICLGLQLFETKTHMVFVDYSFVMMVEYLWIQRRRMEKGMLVEKKELEPLEKGDERLKALVDSLEFAGQLRYPPEEQMYMGLLLWGAEFQQEKFWQQRNRSIGGQAGELCHYIVSYLSEATGLSFYGDHLLAEGLETFLYKCIIRTRYGFAVDNPYLEEVKTNYGVLFNTCFGMGSHIREVTGKIPSEHEMAFLTLLIGGALLRIEKKINAVLVGAGSLLLAEVTARKIEKQINGLRVIAVLSRDDLETAVNASCDLVITTILGLSCNFFSVYVTPIVNEQDILHLQKACQQLYTSRLGWTEQFTLKNYIQPAFILLDVEAETKNKLIQKGCFVLEQAECVTSDYYQEILNREAISSTEIGNGVAIPHGIENHVRTPAVCMIRLKKKINWGNSPVDIIFLLALNFNDGETTRRFFKLFYEKVGNEQMVARFRKAKTREEVLELLQ